MIVLGEIKFIMTHLLDTSWDVQYLKIKLSACSYLDLYTYSLSLYRSSHACAGVCASESLSIAGGRVLLDEY